MNQNKIPTGKLRYKLTNDYLFHIVFQKNEKILRGLVKSLLSLKDEEIIDIRLENPIHPGDDVDEKSIIMDLLITLNNNRKINIEMQVSNYKDWPERSLYYLCKAFSELDIGKNYSEATPVIHIGILDFTLFPKVPEFYAHYAFENIINHNIYSDKLLINVLDLSQTEIATDKDVASGLLYWSRLFKAETWEEIRMLQSEYNDFANIEETMQTALNDKQIRMQCEARERYERDKNSAYYAGREEGIRILIEVSKESNTSMEETMSRLMKKYNLSEVEANKKLEAYW